MLTGTATKRSSCHLDVMFFRWVLKTHVLSACDCSRCWLLKPGFGVFSKCWTVCEFSKLIYFLNLGLLSLCDFFYLLVTERPLPSDESLQNPPPSKRPRTEEMSLSTSAEDQVSCDSNK